MAQRAPLYEFLILPLPHALLFQLRSTLRRLDTCQGIDLLEIVEIPVTVISSNETEGVWLENDAIRVVKADENKIKDIKPGKSLGAMKSIDNGELESVARIDHSGRSGRQDKDVGCQLWRATPLLNNI